MVSFFHMSPLPRVICSSLLSIVSMPMVVAPSRQPAGIPADPAETRPFEARTVAAPPEHLSGTGVIVARETIELAPLVERRLEAIHVQVGDTVRACSVLAELEEQPTLNALLVARSLLAEALADTLRAASEVELAEYNLASNRTLAKLGPGTVSELVMREAERDAAKARADLAAVMARVDHQKAQIKGLEDELDHTKIQAPFDGIVATRYRDPGSTVDPNKPILRLISIDLLVRFAVEEADLVAFQVGASVKIEVLALGAGVEGCIERIAPEVDTASGMIVVEAEITNWGSCRGRARSGMEVFVHH